MKQSPRGILVLRQPLGALDRLAEVWNDSVTPAPHLIAKDAQVARPTAPDSTSADDPPLVAIGVWYRATLNREAALRHVHLKRRVVEVEPAPAFEQRHSGLEDLAIESHGVASGA